MPDNPLMNAMLQRSPALIHVAKPPTEPLAPWANFIKAGHPRPPDPPPIDNYAPAIAIPPELSQSVQKNPQSYDINMLLDMLKKGLRK